MESKTVLIVDDEPDILRILCHYLQNAGYRVIQAHGVEDAVRKLERVRYAVDLVLTDLGMPGMSGVNLIEHLKQNPDTCHMPVVAVTAFTWDTIGRAAADYGADAFINKPVNRQLLVKTVHDVLERAAAER